MDTELAYLAGFFDGEGYVGIHRVQGRYSVRISVTQIDPTPPILFQRRFSGRLHRAPDRRGFRPLIVWTLVAGRAAEALREMQPYLTVKHEQAVAAIELQERIVAPLLDRTAEMAERERLYQLCRDLKQRNYDHIELPSPPLGVQDHKGKRLPRVLKPKRAVKVRTKVRTPVISAQGRPGRPAKGASRKPAAIDLDAAYRELGIADTARLFGVSRQAIYNWLDSYGIPRQGYSAEAKQRRSAAIARTWKEPE